MVGGRGPERRQKGRRPVWESERVIRPMKPGNAGGGKDPYFWDSVGINRRGAVMEEIIRVRDSEPTWPRAMRGRS